MLKLTVPADATQHRMLGKSKCRGDLVRTGCGADRMSEHLGRIVVQCSECGERLSLPTSKEKL